MQKALGDEARAQPKSAAHVAASEHVVGNAASNVADRDSGGGVVQPNTSASGPDKKKKSKKSGGCCEDE